MDKIAIGLSGGVDSAVAAWLLLQDGHEVVAFTMRLPVFSGGVETAQADTLDDARRVAECLRVPLAELDLRDAFGRDVLTPFADAYADGLTPNPCALCNRAIKFGALADAARRAGCDALATGHYAQTQFTGGRWQLLCAADPNQDQSYFLHRLSQEQISFARFPIGHLAKAEVRALADAAGLPVSRKRGSRDLCFLPGGDYREFLRARCPGACQPGPVRHALTNEILGTHPGTASCTIGQRKGLGIATGEPFYAVELQPATRTVFAGPREMLSQDAFCVREVNWISIPRPNAPTRVMARTRYRQKLFAARVEPLDGDAWRVVPDAPQDKAAPGQSAVFYDGAVVMGGGIVAQKIMSCDGK